MPKPGRNDLCPCGSERKYKHCHGAASATATPPALDRRALEATTANLARLLRDQDFASLVDAQGFLDANIDRLNAGDVPEARSPVEAAQDLMYDAWDATGRDRVRLAREALAISADCADAYVLLAEEAAKTPAEAVALYREGVAAGERHLGDRLVDDLGHFWAMVDTRPYMRARAGLAEALWTLGREEESIAHLWELLRLNPNDNQGIRDALLPRLLSRHDRVGAHRLLAQFDDPMAVFAYGRALLAFQEHGAGEAAGRALSAALQANAHVPQFLLGERRLPRQLPGTYGFGDEDEAVLCAAEHMAAWAATEGALAWLAASLPGERDLQVRGRAVKRRHPRIVGPASLE